VVLTNTLSFIKYSVISILLVVLYFVWLDKNYFSNSYKNQRNNNSQLQKQIKILNQQLLIKDNEIKKLKLLKQKEVIIYKKVKQKNKKAIKIILPKNNIDYSKIIPKEDYNFIDKNKVKNTKESDKVKITPSVTFDDQNNVDTIKVNIKTKF